MRAELPILLEQTLEAVKNAGRIITEHHQKPRNIRYKGRIDLVTETDVAVEEYLKVELSRIYPGSTFMAEESSTGAELGEATWIIDPVDGTTNFAHGLPFVASSVALWHGGRVVLGVVNAPLLNECFWATVGGGAFLNGQKLKVSSTTAMERALVATGFPYTVASEADTLTSKLNRVLKAAQGVRRYGAAAIDLAYLAAGRYDAFYENGLKAWDVAAGWILIEEAGGTLTHFDGGAYGPGDDEVLAASTLELHQSMQDILLA